MAEIRHQYATVRGHRVFYREAGPRESPTLVLLHGFPTSSRMFRHLIPALADRFHVIAPDHLGFGRSDTPAVDEFTYTFDSLTDITEALLAQLGVTRYAQIAAWTDADVARIDAQLGTFAGRITRDSWIEQAKLLAAGDTAGFEGKFGKL